jgi:hypothetical protein
MSNLDIAGYNRLGQVFCAANVAAKSVIAVTTAMTGLILYNPRNSGKVAILIDAGFVWTTAPAAVHNIGIALAAPNATAPSSLTAAGSGVLLANGTGNAGNATLLAYDAATLPVAPVAVRWFGGGVYGSGVGESPYSMIDRIEGAICLVPGAVACLTVVTTTAVGMGSFTWAEVPA